MAIAKVMPATSARSAAIKPGLFPPPSPKRRSIVRATGVSRRTIAERLKKALTAAPCWPRLRPKKGAKKRWPALNLDEVWTFLGASKHKVWLWLAVERESRRIVAWVLGDRSRATAWRLWQQLLAYRRGPRCWYLTDLWESYVGFCPTGSTDAAPKAAAARAS